MPNDPQRALNSMLATADIRQNLIERAGIGARPVLARAIVELIEDETTGLRNSESLFRRFMKEINLQGAGIVFEVWDKDRVRGFMYECLDTVAASAS